MPEQLEFKQHVVIVGFPNGHVGRLLLRTTVGQGEGLKLYTFFCITALPAACPRMSNFIFQKFFFRHPNARTLLNLPDFQLPACPHRLPGWVVACASDPAKKRRSRQIWSKVHLNCLFFFENVLTFVSFVSVSVTFVHVHLSSLVICRCTVEILMKPKQNIIDGLSIND